MTTGNTPLIRIGSRSPDQKQPAIFYVYHRYAHRRVAVLNLAAMVAIKPFNGTEGFDLQLPTAMRAEFKLHRPSSNLKKPGKFPGFLNNALFVN